jgi:hypothetical protein
MHIGHDSSHLNTLGNDNNHPQPLWLGRRYLYHLCSLRRYTCDIQQQGNQLVIQIYDV